MVRQQLGLAPINAVDTATKSYVDNKASSGSSGSTANSYGIPTYVQQTDPALTTSYIWYQVNSSGTLLNVWVNFVANTPTTPPETFNLLLEH